MLCDGWGVSTLPVRSDAPDAASFPEIRVQDLKGEARTIICGSRPVRERVDGEVAWTNLTISRGLAAVIISRRDLPVGPAFERNKQCESPGSSSDGTCNSSQHRTLARQSGARVRFRRLLYHSKTSNGCIDNDSATIVPMPACAPPFRRRAPTLQVRTGSVCRERAPQPPETNSAGARILHAPRLLLCRGKLAPAPPDREQAARSAPR